MNLKKNAPLAALMTGIVALSVLAGGLPAYAAGTYPTLAVSNIRSQPTTSSSIIKTVAKGTRLTIDCYATGQAVGGVTIWDRVTSGGYISDTLLLTGSNNAVVPACIAGGILPVVPVPVPPAPQPVAYNPQAAVNWALAHVNDAPRYGEDCTWYVSQALWAGGLPKTTSWSDTSVPLFKPTANAVNANRLKDYLVTESRQATIQELSWGQNNVPQAQLGDLIAYDWGTIDANGNLKPGTDGIVDHMMIITGFSGQYPLVSGHTAPTANQGWTWSKSGNNWYSVVYPGARVYLVHIVK